MDIGWGFWCCGWGSVECLLREDAQGCHRGALFVHCAGGTPTDEDAIMVERYLGCSARSNAVVEVSHVTGNVSEENRGGMA
jgi:hypothetical protein